MKRSMFIIAVLALVFAVGASAKVSKSWYLHSPGKSGKYVCSRNPHNALGTFETKAACKAAIPTEGGGGGDTGGGDNGGGQDQPPVIVPVVGPSTPDSIFLCTPSGALGVWQKDQAATLVADDGYTEAEAVAGNVEDGTNVGSYHLTCGAAGSDTGFAVGDNGALYGPDYGPANEELGFYALFA